MCKVTALFLKQPKFSQLFCKNRVAGKRSSFLPTLVFRTLTPPYVTFGIRLFLFLVPLKIYPHYSRFLLAYVLLVWPSISTSQLILAVCYLWLYIDKLLVVSFTYFKILFVNVRIMRVLYELKSDRTTICCFINNERQFQWIQLTHRSLDDVFVYYISF